MLRYAKEVAVAVVVEAARGAQLEAKLVSQAGDAMLAARDSLRDQFTQLVRAGEHSRDHFTLVDYVARAKTSVRFPSLLVCPLRG